MKTERGWENAQLGLERYPTFAQMGPDCQKRKQMQRTKKSQHAYFQGWWSLHHAIAASSSGASFFTRWRRATGEEPQGTMGRIHSRWRPFPASGYEADPIAFHLCFIVTHDLRISESWTDDGISSKLSSPWTLLNLVGCLSPNLVPSTHPSQQVVERTGSSLVQRPREHWDPKFDAWLFLPLRVNLKVVFVGSKIFCTLWSFKLIMSPLSFSVWTL